MTDVNGIVVWKADYTPFGVATVNEDPDGDGILVKNNFRFPGQYYDAETGLNYNYFRTYDPLVGRYTQSDPIGLRGGLNSFGYVLNDPVNSVDILGLIWVTVDKKYNPRSIPLFILNMIAKKIGSGVSPGMPAATRDEYVGLKRKVIQEWQCDPNDPPETASLNKPKPGDRREIQQTYVITIRGPLKDNLVKKPASPFFYHWVPFVPDRTYDIF